MMLTQHEQPNSIHYATQIALTLDLDGGRRMKSCFDLFRRACVIVGGRGRSVKNNDQWPLFWTKEQ